MVCDVEEADVQEGVAQGGEEGGPRGRGRGVGEVDGGDGGGHCCWIGGGVGLCRVVGGRR